MGRNSKSKPKARSAPRGRQARPSDPLQKVKCSQHYSHARMLELNQKRLQIGSSLATITCLPCSLEVKTKSARRYDYGDSWICLECGHILCGGGGFSPEGHVRAHHKEEPEHRWFANSKNPDVLYCRECNQEVPLKVFKYRPSQNEGTAKSGAEASTELEPNTDPLDQKELDSNRGTSKSTEASTELEPITDQPNPKEEEDGGLGPNTYTFDLKNDDGLDKKEAVTQQMKPVEAEGKGSSSSSSPHSEDVAKYNVIKGLPNLGNTCFFNAMLQCLLALDPLRSIMMGQNVCKGPIAALFKELFVDTSPSSNAEDYLDQSKLFASVCTKWPQFSAGGMEDAEELIQCFLDGLNEEEDEARQPSMDGSKKVTIVDSIFAGEECSGLTSTECLHDSAKRDKILIFRLAIPDRELPAVPSRSNKADAEAHDGDDPVSVEDCFSLYTKEELISDWVCESCTNAVTTKHVVVESGGDDKQNNQKQEKAKISRAARKRMIITKAPGVLVISLKRQKKAPNRDGYDKLEGHVRFNEILSMQPYMDTRFHENGNNTYRLVGVAQHTGDREGGHYIVYVRASKMNGQEHQSNDKSWFYANDNMIREASLQEVLDCEAYILFYERCSNHDAQSSANVTNEESRPANLLPMLPKFVGDLIPPPMDDLVPWDEQRKPSRDKRREQGADKKNATLLPMFWKFLDEFTLSGETMSYYRFQLWGMLVRGSGSRELHILYSHLLSWSKDLAMGVCNGGERLRVKLTEIARKYMLELVTSLSMVVTECTRNLMQQLELRFLEMPKRHEELKESLGAALLREMDVYGHVGKQIMIPLPDKCAVIQGLTGHVISKHRDGYSWEGDFGIEDVDVYDGRVVITKSPKLFEILPRISPKMVTAMEKDFDSIATKVLKKFTRSDIYVPYLLPFQTFLSGMNHYARWWSDRVMTKDLRELILHFPFYKPLRARMNLLVGIFDAWRSFDGNDTSTLLKKILERAPLGLSWLAEMRDVKNQIILDVFCYKDKNLSYYEEKLHFMIELFRHLAVHGTEKSFEYQYGDGSRKQMVQNLDELEVGGAYYLEAVVMEVLTALLEESAMKDMLESVWECYKNCNFPSQN